jgi:hypothetical protein
LLWKPPALLKDRPPAKLEDEPWTFSAPPRCGALIEPAEPKCALVRVALLKRDVEEWLPNALECDAVEPLLK